MRAPVLTGERLLCVDTLLNGFLEQSLDPFCGERVGGSEGVKMIKGGVVRAPLHGSLLQVAGKSECAISHLFETRRLPING